MQTMQMHCEYGLKILRGLPSHARISFLGTNSADLSCQSPILKMAATISVSHHEKWNGTGYPLGLAGDAIPLEGRIVAVADVFDALGSRRPYKEPLPLDCCFEIIEEGRGGHFDPNVVDAFMARTADVVQVACELADD
jgi:putative two-component system response regulator